MNRTFTVRASFSYEKDLGERWGLHRFAVLGERNTSGESRLRMREVWANRPFGGGFSQALALEGEPVRPAVALRIDLALLGILHGDGGPPVAREAEEVERVEQEVAREVPRRDGDAAEHLRQVEPF